MEIKTVTLDGKLMAYTNQTEFLVQVGKNRSAYRTKWSFTGNIHQAVSYYRALNVGLGYKKRLLMPSAKHPVLAKQIT
jgi:hypothetical protein